MEQNSGDMLADGIESISGTKFSLMEQNSGDMLADGIESESGTKILIEGAGHLPPFPTRDSQIRAMTE
jgi:hypothetical protein